MQRSVQPSFTHETRGSGSGGACAYAVCLPPDSSFSKKQIMLINTVLIIVIIAVGVVAWYFVAGPGANKNKNAKRFILDAATTSHRVISGQSWAPTIGGNAKPVVAGQDWTGETKRAVKFLA